MKISLHSPVALLAAVLLSGCHTCAVQISATHNLKGIERHTVLKKYGLAAGAHIDLFYSCDGQCDGQVLVTIVNEEQWRAWFSTGLDVLAVVKDGCSTPSFARWLLVNNGELSWVATQAGRYTITLQQCSSNANVTAKIWGEAVNQDPKGNLTQQLPIEKTMLPNVYYALCVAYALLAATYVGELIAMAMHVKALHLLLAAAVVIKVVELGLFYAQFKELNVTGTATTFFTTSVQLVSHFSTAVFLTCLLCISLGVSITRDAAGVHAREMHVLVLSVISYFVLGVLAAPCAQYHSQSDECMVISVMSTIMRSLVLLITIVAMNFNFALLRVAATETPWTRDTILTYARMKQYESLRWVFIGYLLLPVLIVSVEMTIFSWQYYWLMVVMHETLNLFMYIYLGATFRPLDPTLFTRCYDFNQDTVSSQYQPPAPVLPRIAPAA